MVATTRPEAWWGRSSAKSSGGSRPPGRAMLCAAEVPQAARVMRMYFCLERDADSSVGARTERAMCRDRPDGSERRRDWRRARLVCGELGFVRELPVRRACRPPSSENPRATQRGERPRTGHATQGGARGAQARARGPSLRCCLGCRLCLCLICGRNGGPSRDVALAGAKWCL